MNKQHTTLGGKEQQGKNRRTHQHIVGEVVLLKLGVHTQHICFVLVIPAALVVAQREARGKSLGARDGGVPATAQIPHQQPLHEWQEPNQTT